MLSSIRSKSAGLVKVNFKMYTLLALDILSLIFCVNLLPLLYENSVLSAVKEYLPQHERVLNFLAAVAILLFVCALRFSLTSSAGRCFYKSARGESADVSDFFYYLSPGVFFCNLIFRFKLLVTKLILFIISFLPFLLSALFLHRMLFSRSSVLIIIATVFTAAAFFITGIYFYLNFSALLFLCPYIFYNKKEKRFRDIVSESQLIMSKRRSVLNKIKISFMPRFLLCVFIVPAIYVWSFYNQTKAVAARCFLGG